MMPNRVYGVDFSGAKDAGRKIWIAGGSIEGDTLRFDVCQQAATLPGSGWQLERALPALRDFIVQQGSCVVGLDFPFGLPRDLVAEDRWEDFALAFGDRDPTAYAFQNACYQAAGDKELRRVTDVEAKTPFSPYNLWIYRQTYYGIRDVLAPLVESGKARVLPMQSPTPRGVWLLEVCPASTLKQMGLYQKYKASHLAAKRDEILTGLGRHMSLEVPESVRVDVVDDKNGDALDSVIAAVATFRALHGGIDSASEGVPNQVEGFVYV